MVYTSVWICTASAPTWWRSTTVLVSRRIPNHPAEFLRIFGELEPSDVAFEATFGWGWFADLLADAGIPAHMAHPLATKAISSAGGEERLGRRKDPRPPAPDEPPA